MKGEYEQQIKQILEKLHFNSIDQFLQLQSLTTDKISSRCNQHGIVVEQYLLRLHEIALKTQLLQKKIIAKKPTEQILIDFYEIFPGVHFILEQGQLLQVLGRANGGKTTLMINCAKQAISKNVIPILLSSSQFCSDQYLQQIPSQKLMIFHFQDIGQLAMLIHSIGNQILQQEGSDSKKKYLLLIDCLSEIQPQDQALQFDCSEKFRRLISIFTTRTQTSIIYSYRVNNSLFNTQYKKQHHRPKCKNSKEWDGWAAKNILIDWIARKKDMKSGKGQKNRVFRLVFAKGLENKMHEIII